MDSKTNKPLSAFCAYMTLLSVIITIGVPSFLYDVPMQPLFFVSWLIVMAVCFKQGYTYKEIEAALIEYCTKMLVPTIVMLAVGAMMGVWISSGTVPSIVYYGLKIISPTFFLVISMLICTAVSFITGSSWAAMGTAGLAMSGIGIGLGISPGLVVGAVISGSLTGDATSLMSASNNLVASLSDTPVEKHISFTLKRLLPSYIIAFTIFLLLGFKFAGSNIDISMTNNLTSKLSDIFNISFISILPIVFLLLLLALKKPIIPSIMLGVLIGAFIGIFVQGYSVEEVLIHSWGGYKIETGEVFLDTILNRGGIISMLELIVMFIFAFGLIGLFNKAGVIDKVLEPLFKVIDTEFKLVCMTVIVALIANTITGAMNVSIVTTSTVMLPLYTKLNVTKLKLSSTLSLVCIMGSPLIPWNTNGIFASSVFGVATSEYMLFSFLNLLTPIVIILLEFLNTRRKPKNIGN